MIVNYKTLNPLGFHLLKLLQDPAIRLIILYGGSSSGKSYSVAQMVLIMTIWDGENTLVMRKVGASISKTIYEDFKVAAKQLRILSMFKFKDGVRQIACVANGAKIDFGGLDDPEKIKGISNYKRVVLDEWSEFDSEDHKQVRKRLRGKRGQQIITTFNPIKETHWIKREVFDAEKWHDVPMDVEIAGKKMPPELTAVKSMRMNEAKMMLNPRTREIEEHAPDTVVIQSTYLNNFWVVGSPDGTYGYYDEQCVADFEKDRLSDPDYYNVYALGEWGVIRTGSEYFHAFNRGQHCAEVVHNQSLPIHISVDNNRLPYISYTFWQVDYSSGIELRQFHEICAGSPDNSARKSAVLVAKHLRSIGYQDKIYLHGDCTTRNSNTIDDEGRSFLDKVISTLADEGFEVVDKVSKSNPSVAMSGEFINAIYEGELPGVKITIGEHCSNSIEDYMSVQKDSNGAILKTKVKNKTTMQTYEEHGHLSDTKRYVVCDILNSQYLDYSNKRKRNLYARDGLIRFYNPETKCQYSREVLYCMPNFNGKFAFVRGRLCGDKWHITDAVLKETSSTDEMQGMLVEADSQQTIVECAPAYFRFVRDLRKSMPNVRAMHEAPDVDRRIAATSDYVKNHLLFNSAKMGDDAEYSQFLSNMLDYNKDSDSKEASAVISGFIQFVVKFGFSADKSATDNAPTS